VTPDHVYLAPARLPPRMGFFDYFPIFMPLKTIYKIGKRVARKMDDDDVGADQRSSWTGKKIQRPVIESVVPLELA
jgi:hypothetical protein